MTPTQSQTIQRIAENAGNRTEFFDGFLRHVASEYEAIGGLAWNCTTDPFRPICQVHDPKYDTLKMSFSETEHQSLLRQAADNRDPILVHSKDNRPTNGSGLAGSSEIPQPRILMAKISTPQSTEVVEIFFRHDEEQEGFRKKVIEVSRLCQAVAAIPVDEYAQRANQPLHPEAGGSVREPGAGVSPLALAAAMAGQADKKIPADALDGYVHSLHQTLDPVETSRQIANECRRLLDCDRVSVIKKSGRKFKISAISGQPSVNRRSNAVHLLRRIVEKVLPTKQDFWYPADGEVAPQIQNPLDKYLAIAATRTMVVIPFFDRSQDTTGAAAAPDAPKVPINLIGGMVIEHCNEQWHRARVAEAVEIASRHAGDAFRSSYQHQNLFLYPLWKWMGKSRILFAARHIGKTAAAVLALIVLAFLAIFLPADFRMTCNGKLVPVERHNVFPRVNGVVDEVLVEHGQQVVADQPLLKMVSLDLEYQITELQGQIGELEQMIRSTRVSRLNREDREAAEMQKQSLQGQKAEVASMQKNLDRLLEKKSRLTVRSPISGEVMTWDVKDQLKQRPVTLSNRLLEIANVKGQWQLMLNLPDRKVGHVLKAQEESDEPLQVEFMLAADPGKTYRGHVIEIGQVTEINADNEQTLPIKVAIDSEDVDILQSESGVSAYIDCGERSSGYVWLHPVYEFFQSKVFFPMW